MSDSFHDIKSSDLFFSVFSWEFQSTNCLPLFVPIPRSRWSFLGIFLRRQRIRIWPFSSIRSIFEQPNRQEQEKIHSPAGIAKLRRKMYLVYSIENLKKEKKKRLEWIKICICSWNGWVLSRDYHQFFCSIKS